MVHVVVVVGVARDARYRPFFSSTSADNPVLHSFPPRRSSDLDLEPVLAAIEEALLARARREALAQAQHGAVEIGEHTSELQSQFHLVCRLLLEKKKTRRSPA